MPTCWVVGCLNLSGRAGNKSASGSPLPADAKLSFHKFPLSKPDLLKQWLHNIGRKGCTPNENSRVCSVHFLDSCFEVDTFAKYMLSPKSKARRRRKLTANAVPTEFAHRKTATPRSTSAVQKRQHAKLLTEVIYPFFDLNFLVRTCSCVVVRHVD